MDQVKELLDMKIAELHSAIESKLPNYAGLLKDIHKLTFQNPAQATLLTPEQIRVIVTGYEKYTNVQLAELSGSKGKGSDTRAAKNLVKTMSVDDI